MVNVHHIDVSAEVWKGVTHIWTINDKLFVLENIIKSLNKRGNEAVTVYIIRYILA